MPRLHDSLNVGELDQLFSLAVKFRNFLSVKMFHRHSGRCSLEVKLFHRQGRAGLAPSWIHADWLGSVPPPAHRPFPPDPSALKTLIPDGRPRFVALSKAPHRRGKSTPVGRRSTANPYSGLDGGSR